MVVSCVQVTRVEHRVLIKKNHSVRLERDLMQAQAATGRGQQRRADTSILQVSIKHLPGLLLLTQHLRSTRPGGDFSQLLRSCNKVASGSCPVWVCVIQLFSVHQTVN